ncbi:MAG: 4-(cytidine 5'-diphospho)-2-C-methyl-D-erythritol kinase [Pyrinomonadaceae bacterium]|nr:4-(cytidine 5'-diphospho)-2-C-methyl-D-erythritol kinase [Pyrinomonadaceae bacterium]
MPVTLPSFAKVNLHLRVLGKREDGYHDIFTVFQTVSLHDTITFEESAGEIVLECDEPNVPTDIRNLVVKAANRIRDRYQVSKGAYIRIEKRIPMGGGLGGGSSNAAVALIGLTRLWGLNASVEDLEPIAADLGADVPFFLHGGTMIGEGLGTSLDQIAEFGAENMIIVTPDVHVSTAAAYEALRAESLTNAEANRILRVCRSEAESPDFLHSALRNDFETIVFAAFPEIGRAKQELVDLGARQVLMSGSGSSVFAIFDKEETRQTALKALDNEVNWRKFAVAAVSREKYRGALELAF